MWLALAHAASGREVLLPAQAIVLAVAQQSGLSSPDANHASAHLLLLCQDILRDERQPSTASQQQQRLTAQMTMVAFLLWTDTAYFTKQPHSVASSATTLKVCPWFSSSAAEYIARGCAAKGGSPHVHQVCLCSSWSGQIFDGMRAGSLPCPASAAELRRGSHGAHV
jgi:hypothetical protein